MPCEIKELVVNTTINEDNTSNAISNNELKESDIVRLINAEIVKAKPKIINDCIDHFNENTRIYKQR
tara:strand:- start:1615 stop:1815 length:201 start_codon:yes stop_codon:yes gene_type:complete